MSLLAEDIVEAHWTSLELRIFDTELRQTFLNEAAHLADLRDPREVAFHVGHKAGHASLAERLGYNLQSDGLARARGTGDESVAVGHLTFDG